MEREIDDLVGTLKSACCYGKKCTLLIGAGCSVKAGIPAAAGIVKIIKQRHSHEYKRAQKKSYPHCMAELSPGVRRGLIAEFVDQARINWAHIAIAQLMKSGFVDRVLTVNFDPLVVQACALVGEFPAVYDFAASRLFKPADIPDKAVFHLHGQRSGFRLLHTEQEMKEHSQSLTPVFEDAGRGRMWIVVGYSGENDPVFGHLAGVPQFDNELYWVTFKDAEPSPDVRKRLLQPGKYAFYIKGYDADGFFVTLAQRLNCFPPDFIGKPFSHLDHILDRVTPYDLPDHENKSIDIAEEARRLIRAAINRYETGVDVPEEDEEAREENRQVLEAQSQLLSGTYEKVIDVVTARKGRSGERLKDVVVWAYLLQGNALADKANKLKGAEADALFQQAEEKYQTALATKPDMYQVLNIWGIALVQRAKTKTGSKADCLFREAWEKYQAAFAIKPDDHEVPNNWGVALLEQAVTKTGAEADRLFSVAGEKFQAALAIKPDMHEALYNWGNILSNQAKTKTGAEADRLFNAAGEKYQAALAIKPDHHEALGNWGTTLHEQAKTKTGAEADRLFSAAGEKYRAALAINPEEHMALYTWGNTLYEQAKTKSGAEADRLFDAAGKKYQAALEIKPDNREALNNWGTTLLIQARTKTGAEAERLFATAEVKLLGAERLHLDRAAYNLACLAALNGREEAARKWLEKAGRVGALPSRQHLERDDDLVSLQEKPWFREFLVGL